MWKFGVKFIELTEWVFIGFGVIWETVNPIFRGILIGNLFIGWERIEQC
jgi:hypothetical protein